MLSHCNSQHSRQTIDDGQVPVCPWTCSAASSPTEEHLSKTNLSSSPTVNLGCLFPPFHPFSRSSPHRLTFREGLGGHWSFPHFPFLDCSWGSWLACWQPSCKREFAATGFARENPVHEVVVRNTEVYTTASGWIHRGSRTDQCKTARHEVGHDVSANHSGRRETCHHVLR